MNVVIASFTGPTTGFDDDVALLEALRARGVEASVVAWDADHDWEACDAVVIRSTWDYTARREEYLAWTERVGNRLHNAPALVRWNSDKRYLADLGVAGFPVVGTVYVAPGDELPHLQGEVVVKPTVSAGGVDTGRFSPSTHDDARALVARIQASGRTAMVQPFEASVDSRGETAVVLLDGAVSHVLRKRAVLAPDEVAPVRSDGGLTAAEAMHDESLVGPGEATDAELDLATAIVADVTERFGYRPLYARVDLLSRADGSPVLLELEAVEPYLYLEHAPGGVDRLADSLVARVSGV